MLLLLGRPGYKPHPLLSAGPTGAEGGSEFVTQRTPLRRRHAYLSDILSAIFTLHQYEPRWAETSEEIWISFQPITEQLLAEMGVLL